MQGAAQCSGNRTGDTGNQLGDLLGHLGGLLIVSGERFRVSDRLNIALGLCLNAVGVVLRVVGVGRQAEYPQKLFDRGETCHQRIGGDGRRCPVFPRGPPIEIGVNVQPVATHRRSSTS